MNIDWNKYMHLVRDASMSPIQVARIIGCSRDSVYRVRKIHKNENLSRYMQGNCDDLPSMRLSRGHMGRERA
jgi:hypothetical protein